MKQSGYVGETKANSAIQTIYKKRANINKKKQTTRHKIDTTEKLWHSGLHNILQHVDYISSS